MDSNMTMRAISLIGTCSLFQMSYSPGQRAFRTYSNRVSTLCGTRVGSGVRSITPTRANGGRDIERSIRQSDIFERTLKQNDMRPYRYLFCGGHICGAQPGSA